MVRPAADLMTVADMIKALHQAAAPIPEPTKVPAEAWAVTPSVADVLKDLHAARSGADATVALAPSLVEPAPVGFPTPSVADVLIELHAAWAAQGQPVQDHAPTAVPAQMVLLQPGSLSARIPTVEAAVPPASRRVAEPPPTRSELEPPVASAAMPTIAREPAPPTPADMQARVIPFVPRTQRPDADEAPPAAAAPAAQAYARPDVPFFTRAPGQPTWVPPPAQPPPPDGYRRPPDARALATGRAGAGALSQTVQPGADGGRDAWGAVKDWAAGVSWWRALGAMTKAAGILLLAYVTLVLILVVAYRWINPPMSNLMLAQRLTGTPIVQRWVPLERISPSLLHAVILSEDGQFCRHRGVDWGELAEAIEQSIDGPARGGSTITMQLVKNLFLWSSKSYVRKAVEIPLALMVERVWSKQRVLEIYLNIAEWGPGIFGAEAAARYHFGRTAASLSGREAALLAVSLPNPFDRQAGRPGIGTQRLADNLQARMRRTASVASCLRTGRGLTAGAADRRWP